MASGRVRFEALDDTPASQGVLGAIVCSALLGAAAIALAYVFENQLAAEKVATLLVQPVGAIWIVLFGCIWMAWRRHATLLAVVLLLTWFWITLWGNGLLAGWLQGSLENPYRKIQPMEMEPDELDAVALLGGGTSLGPGERSQLDTAGDRVLLAARMHHAKLVAKIICTGESLLPDDTRPSASQQSKELLMQVGVPENAIIQRGGRNTKEEMAALKEWQLTPEEDGSKEANEKRLGVITSAWHMKRVEALAAENSMTIVPLPCDFSPRTSWSIRHCVPTAAAMNDTAIVLKEYLGRWLKR